MFQLDESKKKIQNTKESKHKKSKQTNKQTGFVTKENDQTQCLRSANMTAREVGVQKEDKNRKISVGWGGVGWGGRNLRTWRKQPEHLRQELKTNSIKRSRS